MAVISCPICGENISVDDLYGIYICPECGGRFNAEDTEEIEEADEQDFEEAHKYNGGLLKTIIFIILIVLLIKWISGPKWTLFICGDLQNPPYRYECNNNALILENKYKNLDQCFQAGNNYLNSYSGFECGYKCKVDKDFGLWVCKKINEK